MTDSVVLPDKDNGYPVVAKCTNCGGWLTGGQKSSNGYQEFRHTTTYDTMCSQRAAQPDREVESSPTPAEVRREMALKSIRRVLENSQARPIEEVIYERAGRAIYDSWRDQLNEARR